MIYKIKILAFIISALFFTTVSLGQKLNVSAKYINGSIVKGVAKVPSSGEKNIELELADGKSITIPSVKLESLHFTRDGNDYIFYYMKCGVIRMKKDGEVKEKLFNEKAWMHVVNLHPKVSCFYAAISYTIKKDGSILYKVNDLSTGYYMKKKEDEYAYFMSNNNRKFVKIIRRIVAYYFGDSPSLKEKIESGDVNFDQIMEVYDAYISTK